LLFAINFIFISLFMVELQNIWRRREKRRNFFEKLNMHWITKLFLPYFLLPFEIWYFFALGLNVAQFMHNNEGVLLQSFTLLMLNLACGLRTLGGKRVWERTREFCFESKCLKNLLPWLYENSPHLGFSICLFVNTHPTDTYLVKNAGGCHQ